MKCKHHTLYKILYEQMMILSQEGQKRGEKIISQEDARYVMACRKIPIQCRVSVINEMVEDGMLTRIDRLTLRLNKIDET